MRKQVLTTIVVSMFAISVTACGANIPMTPNDASTTESAEETSQKEEVESAEIEKVDEISADQELEAGTSDNTVSDENESDTDNSSSDITEEKEPEDETIEEDFLVKSIDDNILYDDNGVKFSFDYLDKNGCMVFTLENNSPDNKKVTFPYGYYYININGFCNVPISFYEYNSENGSLEGSADVLSGEKKQIGTHYHINQLENRLEMLDCKDYPIETIGISIGIQIGTDSEETIINKVMKTDKYNEDDMKALYGEYVTDSVFQGGSPEWQLPVSVYFKKNSNNGITAVIKNNAEVGFINTGSLHMYVNEIELSHTNYSDADFAPTCAVAIRCDEPIEDIRKLYEISNDDPVVITLSDAVGTVVTLAEF